MLAAYASALCSTEFLYLEAHPGPLDSTGLAMRLSLFLWNSPPDSILRNEEKLTVDAILRDQTERLLKDEKLDRFVKAFLDYWLDLRDLTREQFDQFGRLVDRSFQVPREMQGLDTHTPR